jgi:hypothetical protein
MQGLAKQEKIWNEKKLCTFDLLKELKTSEQYGSIIKLKYEKLWSLSYFKKALNLGIGGSCL